MNKQDWTYKKFEDCLVKAAKAKQVQTTEYNSGTKYPIISQEDKMVSGYCDDDSLLYHIDNPVVIFGDHTRVLKYVDFDFVVGADGVKILIPKDFLKAKFLLYYLRWYQVPSLGYSRHYKLLKEIVLPVPPIAEQERIVAELDLLSGIIEKKKEQLKAYDQLAQSIFYTMFGDPIDNPKGWEVKNMEDVGELQRGSGLSKKDLTEDGFPCILYGQVHTRFGAYTNKHIACIPQELVSTAKIAHFGDIVMAITSEDVEGSCKSVAWMGNYDIAVGSDAAIYRHTLNPIYVSYYTQTKAFYFEKAKYAKGFKVTHISTKEIAKIPIPVPPLSLQQEFAEKVEAIARQKALVQQSIDETQTMFDYTMDKYFG